MKKIENKLFYFIAGEPSGDLHAANIMSNLKQRGEQSFSFRGLGGPLMEKNGLVPLDDFNRLSVMGFSEIFKDVLFFINLKKKIIKDVLYQKPDKIVLIDYPGFNLSLAKSLKACCNIPIIYYISPQVWAWKENRIKNIKKYIDELVVIFPFEVSWYQKRGVHVKYFGHPLIDLYKKQSFNNKLFCVGIFLGSRTQEIDKHAPVVKGVIKILEKNIKNVFFIIGSLKHNSKQIVESLGLQNNYRVVYDSFSAFDESNVAIVASGTATLECAITKTPFVVIYKTSFISWAITRFFVKIDFASIVNILAKKLLVEECLQNNCSVEKVAYHVLRLARNNDKNINFDNVINQLGDGSAYKQMSRFLLSE